MLDAHVEVQRRPSSNSAQHYTLYALRGGEAKKVPGADVTAIVLNHGRNWRASPPQADGGAPCRSPAFVLAPGGKRSLHLKIPAEFGSLDSDLKVVDLQ